MTRKSHARITTEELSDLSLRLFNPCLKPPRTMVPPKPPSLAASKLPPPCAEIDDRPTWRVRRFRIWRESVPPLLLAVLDPKRRAHLTRYQSYANPTTTAHVRGVKAWQYTPPPKSPPPTRPLVLPRTPYPFDPSLKVPKWERKARYQRLLEYKYALDQEHERRFRLGMGLIIKEVLDFERRLPGGCLANDLDPGKDIEEFNVEEAVYLTQMFKDIRKKSTNIYHYLAQSNTNIHPVPRREELHEAIKAENRRKERGRAKKERERFAREQAAQVAPQATFAPAYPASKEAPRQDGDTSAPAVEAVDNLTRTEAKEELTWITEWIKETKARIETRERVEDGQDNPPAPKDLTDLTKASTATSVSISTPSERSRPSLQSWQSDTHPGGEVHVHVPRLRAPVPRRVQASNLVTATRRPDSRQSESSRLATRSRSPLDTLVPGEHTSDTEHRHHSSTLLWIRTPPRMDKAALNQLLPRLISTTRYSNTPSRPASARISELPEDGSESHTDRPSDLPKDVSKRQKKTHDRRQSQRRKAATALQTQSTKETVPQLCFPVVSILSSYSSETEDHSCPQSPLVDYDDSDLPTTRPSHISNPYADLNRDVDTAVYAHSLAATTKGMAEIALTSDRDSQSGSECDYSAADTYRPHAWDMPRQVWLPSKTPK